MLSASSVQEAHDFALVAHAATLRSRVPFLHFFDGYRTSHEVNKIALLTTTTCGRSFGRPTCLPTVARRLTPDHPVLRGSAQNPDVFFQSREAANSSTTPPGHRRQVMDELADRTGRALSRRRLRRRRRGRPRRRDHGLGCGRRHRDGAGARACTARRSGLLTVRLLPALPRGGIVAAFPKSARPIAVLDRTKEPGATGEPLYLDVRTALAEAVAQPTRRRSRRPIRLSSKEFTPSMVKGVFDELRQPRTGHTSPSASTTTSPTCRSHPTRPSAFRRAHFRRCSSARLRRHGGRSEGIGQDRRREHRQERPGVLRVRLAQSRVRDDVTPALRQPGRSARPISSRRPTSSPATISGCSRR